MASPTDGQLSRLGDGATSSILITVLNYGQYTGGPEICQHLRWLISAPKSGEGQWRMTSPVTCWAMLFGGSRVFSTSPHAAGSNHGCLCQYPGTVGTVSFLRKGPRSCRKSGKETAGIGLEQCLAAKIRRQEALSNFLPSLCCGPLLLGAVSRPQ